MGGNKGEASFSKGNNGGEREGKKLQPKEEERAFYTPTTKYDRWSQIESFLTKIELSGSTAISIAAADSHDEEGVVLPRG